MSKFDTEYGKTVESFIDPKTVMVKVRFSQGGELPQELSGLFSSMHLADTAIKNYIEKDKPPVSKPNKGYVKKEQIETEVE